jgi:hypothetical protein
MHALLVKLEKRGKGLFVATLSALNQAAFARVPFGCFFGRNRIGCCCGNRASRHCSLFLIQLKCCSLLSRIPGELKSLSDSPDRMIDNQEQHRADHGNQQAI